MRRLLAVDAAVPAPDDVVAVTVAGPGSCGTRRGRRPVSHSVNGPRSVDGVDPARAARTACGDPAAGRPRRFVPGVAPAGPGASCPIDVYAYAHPVRAGQLSSEVTSVA